MFHNKRTIIFNNLKLKLLFYKLQIFFRLLYTSGKIRNISWQYFTLLYNFFPAYQCSILKSYKIKNDWQKNKKIWGSFHSPHERGLVFFGNLVCRCHFRENIPKTLKLDKQRKNCMRIEEPHSRVHKVTLIIRESFLWQILFARVKGSAILSSTNFHPCMTSGPH